MEIINRNGRLSVPQSHIIKNNLTGNKYGIYIERPYLEKRIIDFLKNDNENYQIVSGLGGLGKSSLIYSVLSEIVAGKIDIGKSIDSIIWVTDSYNPGDLTIKKLSDEINAVYGLQMSSTGVYPGSEDKIAKDFLKACLNSIVILVIDNFETVEDEKLKRFIFELPQTCKIIFTSKINREACIQSGAIVVQNSQCINDLPISPFNEDEWELLFNRIRLSVEKIDSWAKTINHEQLKTIIKVIYKELGGIPFPFQMVLNQIADKKLSDINKIKMLVEKSIGSGDFDRMISYSWNKIDSDSRKVLIAASLRGYLSTLDFQQLSELTDLAAYDEDDNTPEIGSDLDRAVEQCLNYKLIDEAESGSNSFYYLPSLVYRFIISKVNCSTDMSKYAFIIRNWIDYYKRITGEVGLCFDHTEKMIFFDNNTQKAALEFVLNYCYKHSLFEDYIVISYNMRYFHYTRSVWEVGEKCIHIKRAKAAHEIGDYISEIEAYIYYINIASKYKQFDKIDDYLKIIEEIIKDKDIENCHPDTFFRYRHALGLYYYHCGDLLKAKEIWSEILIDPIKTNNIHDIDAAQRWYAKCLLKGLKKTGQISEEYLQYFNNLLEIAKKHQFERAIIDYTFMLVSIYQTQGKDDQSRHLLFDVNLRSLIDKTQDVLYTAKYYLWCSYYSSNDQREEYLQKLKKTIDASSDIKNVLKDDVNALGEEYRRMLIQSYSFAFL